jgi:hypothetical protein
MSSSGTLLSDLDSNSGNDKDIISEIMADMNGGNDARPPSIPSMPPAPMIMNTPNPNSTLSHTIDNGPATAHIIGRDHPTNADFQHALNSAQMSGGSMGAPYNTAPPPIVMPKPKKQFLSRILGELRQPFFVVILFFVFNLPVINFLFAHYIPRFVKATGELTTVGLLIKSFFAGIIFWFVNRILVPLLSVSSLS